MKTLLLITVFTLFPMLVLADEKAPETSAAVASPKPAEKAEIHETAFTGEALALQKRMDALFEASKHVNEKGAAKTKSRATIEGALDWDKVAEVCLGPKKWKSESASNKSQFKGLLKDVIILTAFSRMDKFWADGTSYSFSKIDVKGNEAKVVSTFKVKEDSFALEYFMSKKDREWYVWDISYEGERYSVNISEQLESFLKEKGFPNLLEKLRKRKSTLIEESAKS